MDLHGNSLDSAHHMSIAIQVNIFDVIGVNSVEKFELFSYPPPCLVLQDMPLPLYICKSFIET